MSAVPFAFGTATTDRAMRHCALTLHAIAAQDRAWVLARLTGPRRVELERLIAELEALGIAPDRELARHVRASSSTTQGPGDAGEKMDEDAVELAAILAGEPASLVAHVLRGRDEKFVDTFLRCVDPAMRDSVRQRHSPGRTTAGIPKALDQALRAEIHVRRRADHPAPAGTRSVVQRWRSGLRRISRLLA